MTQTLPVALDFSPNQGLAGYFQAVHGAPILSVEEEREFARRYSEQEDLEAARRLVFSHLRYVVSIARGFMGYGLPLADLIQEGNIGLMKAVKRYDHTREVRLVSFAVYWIRAEIYEYVVRNWRMVKIATTKAQRKLFFNLRKNRARLGWMKNDEVESLAKKLDVEAGTVREMESRLNGDDVTFDIDLDDEESVRWRAPAAALADSRNDPGITVAHAHEAKHRAQELSKALDTLDDRSRDIIERRWLDQDGKKPTLGVLAKEYGVSAERIRQIEKSAVAEMRSFLTS
jgi:RNA polymerase sigma-32 factor